MWQRIQTLYLFIAMLMNSAIFWLSLATVYLDNVAFRFDMYTLSNVETGEVIDSTLILAILGALTIVLSISSIASFKKRQIQIKLSQFNLLVQAGFLAAIFFIVDGTVNTITGDMNVSESVIDYQIGAYLALLPLIFIFMAIKAIKKDEALVRAADRIR